MSGHRFTVSDVTPVICVYTERRWDDIVGAIDSLLSQSRPPNEIVVVVDHNPGLHEMLLEHVRERGLEDRVRVFANVRTKGLSGARNSGVAATRTPIVAFLDDDAAANPDWIERIVAAYQSPLVRGAGGYAQAVWPDDERPRWFPDEFDWVVGCSYVGQPEDLAPVRNFIGANMSLLRDDIVAAGGFHEGIGRVGRIPLGCEETELCIRIAQQHPGCIMLFDPGIRVRHRVTADRTGWAYFRRRCYAEGISKAAVSHLVGSRDGLQAERAYTSVVLPRGIARRLAAIPRREGRRHLSATSLVAQSGTIVAGVLVTASGYVRARASRASIEQRPASTVG
ncbi:glycosyltransferase family 2 protein [Gordonia sp. NPDC003429]